MSRSYVSVSPRTPIFNVGRKEIRLLELFVSRSANQNQALIESARREGYPVMCVRDEADAARLFEQSLAILNI